MSCNFAISTYTWNISHRLCFLTSSKPQSSIHLTDSHTSVLFHRCRPLPEVIMENYHNFPGPNSCQKCLSRQLSMPTSGSSGAQFGTESREPAVSNDPAHVSDDEQMSLISHSCDEDQGPSSQHTLIPQTPNIDPEQAQRVPGSLEVDPPKSPDATIKGITEIKGTPDIDKPLWSIWAFELACLLLSVLLFICTSFLPSKSEH